MLGFCLDRDLKGSKESCLPDRSIAKEGRVHHKFVGHRGPLYIADLQLESLSVKWYYFDMEQLGQNKSIEINDVKPPEVLEAKADADPALAVYSSQPENNPLSQTFMEKYGVEYSDPQALAENPDKPSPEISIVIPVHNEGENIIGLLESLSSQASDKSAEIVLVINNDTVGTRDIIDRAIAEGKIDGSKLRLFDCSYETKEVGDVTVGGVGLARKIGMDYAVSSGSETIVSLDADWDVGDGFIDQVDQTMLADVDGFTFQTEGIANDDNSREYMRVMGQVQRYREALGISAMKREADSESPLDKNTGAVHVIRASSYAKAGGMAPVVTGEDGRFGARVSESGARLKKSEIAVGVEIRESDTPGGQGQSLKKFNEGLVTNPDKPGEYITIEEAQEKMDNSKEFQAAQERQKKIEEISKELLQELINFYEDNKEKLQTLEIEDIDSIKEKANSSPLVRKYLLSSENDFSQLIGILKDSHTVEQFISELRDKLGDSVKERIEESVDS